MTEVSEVSEIYMIDDNGCMDTDYDVELTVGKLEGTKPVDVIRMCRYISRNKWKDTYKATEEEKLIEVVTELTDSLEEDRGRELDEDEDELQVLYPKFSQAVAKKADLFKEDKGYRRLCCVPSFILGLAMVGRVGRHYMHSPWFSIGRLGDMLGEYGGVSKRV